MGHIQVCLSCHISRAGWNQIGDPRSSLPPTFSFCAGAETFELAPLVYGRQNAHCNLVRTDYNRKTALPSNTTPRLAFFHLSDITCWCCCRWCCCRCCGTGSAGCTASSRTSPDIKDYADTHRNGAEDCCSLRQRCIIQIRPLDC